MRNLVHLSRGGVGALALLATLLSASPSRAHGAFPKVLQVAADPSNASRLWVRATHGVLTSADAGKTWSWLCTAAAGYSEADGPILAVTANGTPMIGAFDGLVASPDQGCDWKSPAPELESSVTGLVVDEKNPDRVVVLLSKGASGGTFTSALWQSLDAGKTWSSIPTSLDPKTLYLSVSVSSSDAKRLYVTGLPGAGGGKNVVQRSDDSGQSWTAVELPAAAGTTAQIVAVHPTDPDQLYVRANLTSSGPGASEGALWVSTDGAQSFKEVLKKSAPLMGFTLSADGASAYAAYGNPRGGVVVAAGDLGLYSASTSDNAFTRVQEGPVACATFIAGELWACTSQFDHGFELGRSADGGKTFTPVMELAGVDGPLECPATSTVGSICPNADFGWDDVCRDIGKCGSSQHAAAEDEGGCGCRSTPARSEGWLALILAGALLVLGRRERR